MRYQNEVKLKGDVIMDAPDFSHQFRMAFEKWNSSVAAEKARQKVMSTFDGKKVETAKREKAKDEK